MGTQQPLNGRLDGWKAISDYLGWHVRTVMRWEAHKGLPIHRVPGGLRHAVYAYKGEIDEWLKAGESISNARGTEVSPISYEPPDDSGVAQSSNLDEIETALSPVNSPNRTWIWFWIARHGKELAFAGAVALLLLVCVIAMDGLHFSRQIRITGVTQLTDDGALKRGLVTDGRTLYFGEYQDGKIGLFFVPASGGAVQKINTPFVRSLPTDISVDGKKLLILAGEGIEVERSLWILRISDGKLRQVGTIVCHFADWSPDSSAIAFSSQNAIYLTADLGRTIRRIQSFDGIPETFQWSSDGLKLRVVLRDPKTQGISFWELVFQRPGQYEVVSLIHLKSDLKKYLEGTMLADSSGRAFALGGDPSNVGALVLDADQSFLRTSYTVRDLRLPLGGVDDVALDWRLKRLFAIGTSSVEHSNSMPHAEFLWFDQSSQEFRPFLAGGGGEYIDFSRDRQWITYVNNSDRALYISRADGSELKELSVPPGNIELPRWSPDGKRIAFMEKLPDKPWRIFVISLTDGDPKEAGAGDDSQGAPTWSPDGKMLTYGSVECQENRTCAIHKIDLATGRESTVPDSEGLGTARWSPDGKFIAALDSIKHRVMLFSESTYKWRELAEGVNGNDLSWSGDSKFLFASRPTGDQPEIIRIDVPDGKITTALDMSELSRLQGRFDSWFTVGPENAIILSREMSTSEIYSISYQD